METTEAAQQGEFLETGTVAKALGVRIQIVERWIRDRKISALRLPSGRYRIPLSELERIKREGAIIREESVSE